MLELLTDWIDQTVVVHLLGVQQGVGGVVEEVNADAVKLRAADGQFFAIPLRSILLAIKPTRVAQVQNHLVGADGRPLS